jgi:hypothetical protein
MQPPAPPPGSSDDPGWQRDESAYGQPSRPQPFGPPSYGPPQYGQPQYGQAPPGYQPYGPGRYGGYEHPQGTTILVLGILSLVVCGILGPFAWSMGSKALREIDANPSPCTNRGSVVAGKICGMIASILLIVAVAFVVIIILATVASSSGSS